MEPSCGIRNKDPMPGYSFSSKLHILWAGAGPSPGHPDAMTPYRTELCGLTSCLYVLQWVCKTESIHCGQVTLFIDNKMALAELFATPRKSNNPYKQLQADTDLLTCARSLLAQLRQ